MFYFWLLPSLSKILTILVQVWGEEGIDVGGTIINMSAKRVEELQSKLPVAVRPVILQEDGFKVAVWEIDE